MEFVLRPGPVTLLAFTPIGAGFRVIAAHGEVLAAATAAARHAARLRALSRRHGAGFDWWCEAGANHHLALTPGHHCDTVRAFAELHAIEARVLE